MRAQSRFGDAHGVPADGAGKFPRARNVGAQRAQIAVVDADDARAEPIRAAHAVRRVCFGEHAHVHRARRAGKAQIRFVVEHGKHQQHRVGAEAAREKNLILVDDEFLAQHGLRELGAHEREVFVSALKEFFVAEHGDGVRALRVDARDFRRRKVFADEALRRRGLLAFEDEGGNAGALPRFERAVKIAVARSDVPAEVFERS